MRRARPRMLWGDPALSSDDGSVLFHADDSATGLHVEAVWVAPYRGRLRAWTDQGTGPLVHDEPVRLPHDLRDPLDEAVTRAWLERCLGAVSAARTPGALRGSRS